MSSSDFWNAVVRPGVWHGQECPKCGLTFAVVALNPHNPESGETKVIPCDGRVDYFCPACGCNIAKDPWFQQTLWEARNDN